MMSKIVANAESKSISYSIVMEQLIHNPKRIKEFASTENALVVTTPTVYKLYEEFINSISNEFSNSKIVVLDANEESKSFENVELLCKEAINMSLGRKGMMIVISGGACTDIVTTAAGLYKRGVDVIRIPTTLIGAIDAGIGIKSSLNYEGNKSICGLYHPPKAVIVDTNFIETLPEKHILCGISEMIKMAIIVDKELFFMIENNMNVIQNPSYYKNTSLEKTLIIHKSILGMIEELQPNFYEDKTYERLVDFGHTFSNSLEPASQWEIPHGYAVAIDIALSSYISMSLGYICESTLVRILNLFKNIGIPIYDDRLTDEVCFDSLEKTALHRGGDINLVVPTDIGEATFVKNDSESLREIVSEGIKYLKEYQATLIK